MKDLSALTESSREALAKIEEHLKDHSWDAQFERNVCQANYENAEALRIARARSYAWACGPDAPVYKAA